MSKHRRSSRKAQAKNLGDVTINDFANSAIAKHRPKKSSTNVTTVIKQLELEESKQTKTAAWDELDEYDFIREENEDGEVTFVLKKLTKCNIKSNSPETPPPEHGNDYPVDIWFLISEHIRPEDVGTFSCLCKTAYSVVNTGKFWYSLYKRHYKRLADLPGRLQPERVFRLYGIRTLVIKSLFYMYTPFLNRLKIIKTEEHPDVLTKRLCVLMWHQKLKHQWIYYFKLKENTLAMVNGPDRKLDLIDILDDINANSEDCCRLLQVTCLNFIPVPPVQGLYLTSVGVTLSQGFRHNRVQLGFNTSVVHGKVNTESSIAILLDPVVNVRVLDWWHPMYPHSYNTDIILNSED